MEWIFDILQQAPWLIFVLLGIFSTLFKGGKKDEQQQKQQQRQQQRQRQQTATQSSQRQEDYEDYRRESAPAPKREDKPRFDWDIDIFGEGKLEELEQKVREKVNPYLEQKKEQASSIQKQMKDEVKELSITGQEISKDSPILKQELQLSEGEVVSSRHRIKPNRVVEGVMWSEILGQPRSRNPHRPVYTEHFSKRK